ncbi:TonB-dependent receptor [Phenylobacterium sp. Root77]|uniref:TonB-dependent receptor n=1 Tax=unclassified Phenylobacterium TaxID=2640670 RepID=UPI0006FED8D7|nr:MULTISPECIES: TonB-dependent receptor [unclassified Phenylobacterium]KQW70504.1 TonB-dependent receptor [Phenylobacterium sp. Root1277]KQW91075.1 TonB-dependent receptor [Phenylobacterium sp. Root1290]KRC39290.1 TonB-dependent receptor [Phenylobacterium sp. Root77]
MHRLLLVGGAAAAALLSSSAAFAADTAPQVEELVVTGEKADRSLQDTVASVALFTERRMDEQNIRNLGDLVNQAANVAETYQGFGFTIRGVANNGVSGGGSGGLATVYLDGAALPDRTLAAGPLDMWDIAQAEILRGPQSTLQGRNTLAGAIVLRTNDPTWAWSGAARAIIADDDSRTLSFAGGGPIVADQLAFRVSFEDRDAEGFTYNSTRKTQEDPLKATTVRGKLLFTPSALPDLTIRAGVTHNRHKGGYIYSYSRSDVPDAADARIATSDFPGQTRSTTDILTLNADYAISDQLKFTSVTAWSKVRSATMFDMDGGPASIAYGAEDDLDRSFSQELRLQYEGERLSGLAGLYFADRDRDFAVTTRNALATPRATLLGVLMSAPFNLPSATANAAANAYVAALPSVSVDFSGRAPEEIQTVALFADGRYQLTPQLSLLAGFRYDREENTLSVAQTTRFAGTYPNPAAFGTLAPVIAGLNQVVGLYVAQATANQPETSRSFEAFLPKVGLKYDLTEDASLSFVAQRGYRSGGANINVIRSAVVPYDPEYTWNYELAARTSWLNDTLTVNANAYYVDWTDQQVVVNLSATPYDYQTENAGASTLYGAEIETAYRPSAAWDLYGSVGYSRTEFDDFTIRAGTSTIDLSGSEFAFAPEWTWNVGGNYRWDNGLFANLNAGYRSESYGVSGPTQGANKLDARTLVGGKFGYQAERWTLAAYTTNLLDEDYVQFRQPTLNRAMYGAPRVVGAILEARW